MKVQLNLSTAYHFQTDGQTEVVNKCVECFLRCMTGERPKEWVKWVSLAEYWHFKIETDHFSLKYLLDQRLTTPFQAKWLPKLLGYDYEISYKQGSENHADDALFKISSGSELCSLIISTVTSELLKQIKHGWEIDVDLQLLIKQLADHTYVGTKYTWTNEELRRKEKLVVGNGEQLKQALVTYFHSDPVGGHSGVQVTVKKLDNVLYWRGMKKLVKKFVAECDVCQRNKPDLSAYPGPLQPLPIPTKVWHDISIDFIEALPRSQGKTVLFVVVDREQAIAMLQFHLKKSQNRIKSMADEHRSDRNFEVGMKVYLKLQPYRQSTVRQGTHHKFAAKYYGPFVVMVKVRKVAYKLQLPPDSQIHQSSMFLNSNSRAEHLNILQSIPLNILVLKNGVQYGDTFEANQCKASKWPLLQFD
nr:hypothetical protein [Tanacetum cinerariifolium]